MQVLWLKMKIQLSEHSYFEDQTLIIQLLSEIINATISFILTTERFNCPLF